MTKAQSEQQHQLEYLQPCLAAGSSPPPGWQPISSLRLIIIVGVTGTGKTTATKNLTKNGFDFQLLPDRRFLTDKLIIAPLQREDCQEVKTLPRMQRVPYIRRYKQRHPAGLAYAVSKLFVDPTTCKDFWVFNGLRGEEEVKYAIEAIPKAQFIVLDAIDIVRAQRLIRRHDPYDQMQEKEHKANIEKVDSFEAIGVPEAAEMFSTEEEQQLLKMAKNGHVKVTEVRDILKLLSVERSLYKKEATISTLLSLAPDRTLLIDTTSQKPETVTKKIIDRFQRLDMV